MPPCSKWVEPTLLFHWDHHAKLTQLHRVTVTFSSCLFPISGAPEHPSLPLSPPCSTLWSCKDLVHRHHGQPPLHHHPNVILSWHKASECRGHRQPCHEYTKSAKSANDSLVSGGGVRQAEATCWFVR